MSTPSNAYVSRSLKILQWHFRYLSRFPLATNIARQVLRVPGQLPPTEDNIGALGVPRYVCCSLKERLSPRRGLCRRQVSKVSRKEKDHPRRKRVSGMIGKLLQETHTYRPWLGTLVCRLFILKEIENKCGDFMYAEAKIQSVSPHK